MFQKGNLALKKVHFLQQMAKSGCVDGLQEPQDWYLMKEWSLLNKLFVSGNIITRNEITIKKNVLYWL